MNRQFEFEGLVGPDELGWRVRSESRADTWFCVWINTKSGDCECECEDFIYRKRGLPITCSCKHVLKIVAYARDLQRQKKRRKENE